MKATVPTPCAQLEASKSFMKKVAHESQVATAVYGVFETSQDAATFLSDKPGRWVVKADGLRAGKGAVCDSADQALQVARTMLGERGNHCSEKHLKK